MAGGFFWLGGLRRAPSGRLFETPSWEGYHQQRFKRFKTELVGGQRFRWVLG